MTSGGSRPRAPADVWLADSAPVGGSRPRAPADVWRAYSAPIWPADSAQAEAAAGVAPLSTSSCHGVRMRGPSAVTATVCSKCAASEPSCE